MVNVIYKWHSENPVDPDDTAQSKFLWVDGFPDQGIIL